MFAFLRKQKPVAERVPFPSGYTAETFMANEGMVSLAEGFIRSKLGGHIMAVLYNGVPSGFPLRGDEVNPTTAAIELGRVQGYMDCMNLLNSLCTPRPRYGEVEQDYGAKELMAADGLEFKE